MLRRGFEPMISIIERSNTFDRAATYTCPYRIINKSASVTALLSKTNIFHATNKIPCLKTLVLLKWIHFVLDISERNIFCHLKTATDS